MMDTANKIPPQSNQTSAVRAVRSAARTAAVEKAARQQIPCGDRVEISAEAKILHAAHEAVRQMPDVDEEKVAAIKARLQAGTYTVDSSKIAAEMIDESLGPAQK
jgi:negative regulator of flagellin synthesis FlgM